MLKFFAISLIASTVGVHRVAAQAGCCSAWWIVPEGSILTKLESTMIVPKLSTGKGLHYVWPGMEPRNGSFVFQNVIGDQQPAGEWSFATWYGPYDSAGDYHEYGTVKGTGCDPACVKLTNFGLVAEGDSLTTDFELDTANGDWVDTWTLEPGSTGHSSGERSSNGGVSIGFPNKGPLTDTIFEIELQEGATWDFGAITWTNIIMEANTTDTSWCKAPVLGAHEFQYTMSTPVSGIVGGTSQCYIAKLTFVSP